MAGTELCRPGPDAGGVQHDVARLRRVLRGWDIILTQSRLADAEGRHDGYLTISDNPDCWTGSAISGAILLYATP